MLLPAARGPLSRFVVDGLRTGSYREPPPVREDPLTGDDLNLALTICYELHYEGFEGVDDDAEWDPRVIAFRSSLERAFEEALAERVTFTDVEGADFTDTLMRLISRAGGPPLARFIECEANVDQFKEFLIHRSAYQLKEADPHSWVIPRLRGPGKAALVEIQADEYGGGRPDRVHAELFAKTMRSLSLDDTYGAFIDQLPGVTLAVVNLVSLFGLHRKWRGAAIGHLAAFEATSSEPNRRYGNGLRRLGFDGDATDFFDEHVEADSVHEQIALHDLAGAFAAAHPRLSADILFGARALLVLESGWAGFLLDRWHSGQTSLAQAAPDLRIA